MHVPIALARAASASVQRTDPQTGQGPHVGGGQMLKASACTQALTEDPGCRLHVGQACPPDSFLSATTSAAQAM